LKAILQQHSSTTIIYHADDDEDDRLLFIEAVDELGLPVSVQQADDGQKLLDMLLQSGGQLPEIVF